MQSRIYSNISSKIRASLSTKLVAIALVTFAIVFGITIYQSNQTILSNLKVDAEQELNRTAAILASELEGDKSAAAMVAISIADRQDVQELVANKNRQGLTDLLTPLFGQLKDQYKVIHFNVIDERGVVILRVNDLENYDDYVFYNFVVSNTINTGKSTSGLEVDIRGLSMRGTAPMFRDGKFIGLIEIGIDYSQAFANSMKQKTGADFTIWFYQPSTARFGVEMTNEETPSPNENFIYYAGTKTDNFRTLSTDFERAFTTFENIFNIYFGDKTAEASLLVPMLGPDDTFFGVTEITFDYSVRLTLEQRANNADQFGRIGISFMGLIAIGAAINFLIVSPLKKISRFAEEITVGSATSELSLKTGDEFEQVSEALNLMGVSIKEKREDLQRQVAQSTAQLKASNEVAKVANSILDPDELISTVVKLITENFGYYYSAIFLVSEDGRWAELKDATGSAGEALKARRHRLQVGGNSMVGSAINLKEARIALDVGDAPVRFNNPLLPNTRSEIALPLTAGNRIVGALDVQSIREADFNPEDISTLQSMANQVAIALENARLFREMNESLEELRQSNREFVTDAWRDKLKAGKLEHTSRANPTLLQNTEATQAISVPINLREQKIGQIALEIGEEWDSEDQAWVEALATQVAISLENSRLLEESQQAALRERLSASIIQKVWSSNNVDTIIQTAVRELARSLDASEVKIELRVD